MAKALAGGSFTFSLPNHDEEDEGEDDEDEAVVRGKENGAADNGNDEDKNDLHRDRSSSSLSQGLFFSNVATQIVSSLLPHLPVSEIPKVLQNVADAFVFIQAHQHDLEKEIAGAESKYRREMDRRQKDQEKHTKRIRWYEERLRESNVRVEGLRRDKEEAYRQISHLQLQFTLWKSHQAESQRAVMDLGFESLNAADEIHARENFRDLIKREFQEKERRMEEMCHQATRECLDKMKAQQEEEVQVHKQRVEVELKAHYEEDYRKKIEEKELRDSKEIQELTGLAMSLQSTIDKQYDQLEALTIENSQLKQQLEDKQAGHLIDTSIGGPSATSPLRGGEGGYQTASISSPPLPSSSTKRNSISSSNREGGPFDFHLRASTSPPEGNRRSSLASTSPPPPPPPSAAARRKSSVMSTSTAHGLIGLSSGASSLPHHQQGTTSPPSQGRRTSSISFQQQPRGTRLVPYASFFGNTSNTYAPSDGRVSIPSSKNPRSTTPARGAAGEGEGSRDEGRGEGGKLSEFGSRQRSSATSAGGDGGGGGSNRPSSPHYQASDRLTASILGSNSPPIRRGQGQGGGGASLSISSPFRPRPTGQEQQQTTSSAGRTAAAAAGGQGGGGGLSSSASFSSEGLCYTHGTTTSSSSSFLKGSIMDALNGTGRRATLDELLAGLGINQSNLPPSH